MNITENLKKGVLEILILSLLNDEDMYGYQLTHEMERRSNGEFFTTPGSLYPMLYRLGEEGCITDHQEKSGKRRVRIYYHLEEKGREHLQNLLAEYKRVSQSIETILGTCENLK